MANYTQISTHIAQDILKLYGIDHITSLGATSSGISNTNYRVEIKGKVEFILKISNSKSVDKIQQEQDILDYLATKMYPYSVAALKTLSNNSVYQSENLVGTVYPFIQGSTPEINLKSVYEMGKALASLHLVPVEKNSNIRKFSELGYDVENIASFATSPQAPKLFTTYYQELVSQKQLEKYLATRPNYCITHGDLYFDNFLFNDQQKVAVMLDFEQAGLGDPRLDIGISISGSCLVGGELAPDLIAAYLKGYSSIKNLTADDLQQIDFCIIMGLFSIALWRIERFNTKKIDTSKQDNYLELLQRAQNYGKKI